RIEAREITDTLLDAFALVDVLQSHEHAFRLSVLVENPRDRARRRELRAVRLAQHDLAGRAGSGRHERGAVLEDVADGPIDQLALTHPEHRVRGAIGPFDPPIRKRDENAVADR